MPRSRWRGRLPVVAVAALACVLPSAVVGEPPKPQPAAFWPPPVLSRERAIEATVRVDSRGGGLFDTGTGIAVGAHVVLTNAHLTHNPITIVTRCGEQVLPVQRIEHASDGSDVAVVVTGGPGLLPVELAANDPSENDRVLLAGYPQGQLALTEGHVEGRLTRVEGVVLRFSPDPRVGQSGSPLFDADGRIAALAYARDTVGAQGLAIPASRLRDLLDEFRARGIPIADPITGDPAAVAARSSICA